jgi:XTP/dITP diphosphohydrolase
VSTGSPAVRLVLATLNPGKIQEIAAIYSHLEIAWLPLADLQVPGAMLAASEEGATYTENAAAKARTASAEAGLPALADDSGIEIDALGGSPGIRSARFLGPSATDAERNARILHLLEDVSDPRRTARYVAAVALAFPGGAVHVFEGTCEGSIARSPRGTSGFGYDPIFVPRGESRTMAEVPIEVKNRISHRARALRAAEPCLVEILNERGKDRAAGSAK